MINIKALFFDVDATLYTHRIHDLPQSTKETLQKLREAGYKVGIATSRCRFETRNLPSFFRNFDFDAEIYDGGALVMKQGEVFAKKPIAQTEIQTLRRFAQKEKIMMRYSTYDNDHIDQPCSSRVKDEFFKLYLNMPSIKAYEGEEVFNMLLYPETKEQMEEVKKLLVNSSFVIHSKNVLEITAKGIDKSIGVQELADEWGFGMDQIACFGDGANDVHMIKKAGLGIAMGNGNILAKEVADYVCGHIDEDGLARICEELNLI